MEEISPETVAAVLISVSSYGGQLAAVFHNYSLIAERVPSGFEGAINILDATVATLKQVLTLLKAQPSKKLFSDYGLKYVHLLALECASALAKVEPAVDEGCLDRKDRKALKKRKKKASSKKITTVLDPLSLSLDEKEFLEKTEKTKWSWAIEDIEACMERLYELQLHLLLVFQVITVCKISRDVSSGNIDIEKLVNYHDRIKRTADLVGVKPPARKSVTVRDRFGRRLSFSSLESSSSSDSDSDASSKGRTLPKCRYPPPPPPPGCGPRSPNIVIDLTDDSNSSTAKETVPTEDPVVVVESTNPPSYAESRKPESSSTMLGTVTSEASEVSDKKDQMEPKDEKEKTPEPKASEPAATEARLFKSKSTGFGFKLRNLFRSKDALAEEMRRTLSDTETQLIAFVIQRHFTRVVPHSSFHSLEGTHMKTILSQLNNDSWYKTFSTLDNFEHGAVDLLTRPWFNGKVHERELVVLKVLQHNKFNAWMALLSQLFRSQPFPQTGRVILAIFREKLENGKPIPFRGMMGPPPPPPPPPMMPPNRNIRPPPVPLPSGPTTRVSDLKILPPPPPPPGWQNRNPMPYLPPPTPFVPNSKKCSVRINDTTLLTDQDAKEVLTRYNEYTVRPCEPTTPGLPRLWSRVVVSQESAEDHLIQKRVEQFEARKGNVIETKLRLTEEQSAQVTRLMDDIKSAERDYRFDWCWVEISLHNHAGEITDFSPNGSMNLVNTATIMHLIAKRTLKPQYVALDVYNSLMKPGPPRPPITPPNPSTTVNIPPPRRRSVSSDSDSDSTVWSSDSSVGAVRRRLRKYRAKKMRSDFKIVDNSDSDSEEEQDVIKINLEMKRGDDVVKKLLGIWTVGSNGKGKEG